MVKTKNNRPCNTHIGEIAIYRKKRACCEPVPFHSISTLKNSVNTRKNEKTASGNRGKKKTTGKEKRNKRDGAVPRRAGLREIKEIKFMRERDVEQKLRREVEKRGGRCFKFLSSVSGVPDRVVVN